MKYLSNKPMFFDMGKKPVDAFDGLQAEPAPSNYFTSAPASLPCAPVYPCQYCIAMGEDCDGGPFCGCDCHDGPSS